MTTKSDLSRLKFGLLPLIIYLFYRKKYVHCAQAERTNS